MPSALMPQIGAAISFMSGQPSKMGRRATTLYIGQMSYQVVPGCSSFSPSRIVVFLLLLLAMSASLMPAATADEWTNVYGDSGPDSFSNAHGVAVADD